MTGSEVRLVDPSVARPAPAWSVERWFNAPDDFGLGVLRGRVVALHAFQMLCPGCVTHGIPQAQRIATSFASRDVAVVGLHTVFDSEGGPIPETMQRYELRGTPSLVLIDRLGRVRLHTFGRLEDMTVGAAIASLVAEPILATEASRVKAPAASESCESPSEPL